MWNLKNFSEFLFVLRKHQYFLDDVRILYKQVSYQFHRTPLLCGHRELACTPKDPPRRVDKKEMSLVCLSRDNY